MSEPKTLQEYNQQYNANSRITGFGIGNVYQHPACPFCCAPDFMCFEILEVREVVSKERVCKSCGRGCKGIFEDTNGSVRLEIVQTCGNDPPDYLTPMRRVV